MNDKLKTADSIIKLVPASSLSLKERFILALALLPDILLCRDSKAVIELDEDDLEQVNFVPTTIKDIPYGLHYVWQVLRGAAFVFVSEVVKF